MPLPAYSGYRFPDVIQLAVWLYLRFTLSYRDVEELLAERGVVVTYERIRRWVLAFGPVIARRLRSSRPKPHGRWHLDEMCVRVGGKQMHLWRAVDAEGEVLDVLLQPKRDTKVARKLMRKLLKKQGMAPNEWVTDKNPSYGPALRKLKFTRAAHVRRKLANHRAESSLVPVRRRKRKLQGFKSPRSAQRFLSLHAVTCNNFNVPRHLVTARIHRLFRDETFEAWRNAAGSAAGMASRTASRDQVQQVDKAAATSV
jgi:putative transposase